MASSSFGSSLTDHIFRCGSLTTFMENPGPFMPSGVYDHLGRGPFSGSASGASGCWSGREDEKGRSEGRSDKHLHCLNALEDVVKAVREPLSAIGIVGRLWGSSGEAARGQESSRLHRPIFRDLTAKCIVASCGKFPIAGSSGPGKPRRSTGNAAATRPQYNLSFLLVNRTLKGERYLGTSCVMPRSWAANKSLPQTPQTAQSWRSRRHSGV